MIWGFKNAYLFSSFVEIAKKKTSLQTSTECIKIGILNEKQHPFFFIKEINTRILCKNEFDEKPYQKYQSKQLLSLHNRYNDIFINFLYIFFLFENEFSSHTVSFKEFPFKQDIEKTTSTKK